MTRTLHGWTAWCLAATWVVGLTGGPAPTPAADSQNGDAIATAQLRSRVVNLQTRVSRLVDTTDLLDSLHFGWLDEPYARATLAIVVKTTAALERELHLRELDNGAVGDGDVVAMLSWADDALRRLTTTQPDDGFRPHRLRVSDADLADLSATPALFGFVDCSTATRHSDIFGDLDLMASMGFRVYARPYDTGVQAAETDVPALRARALGMATVMVAAVEEGAPEPPPNSLGPVLTIEPLTLRGLLERPEGALSDPRRAIAVQDSVWGESWESSLARRALARGATGRARFVTAGWSAPRVRGPKSSKRAASAAAMWIHAMEGQSLGLLRGWRDLRDGSGSLYRSTLSNPAGTETISHTALDLLRSGQYLLPFRTTPRLAIAIPPDSVDDDNEWAAWIEPLWQVLFRKRIRFDVVGLDWGEDRAARRYRTVFPVRRDDLADLPGLCTALEKRLAGEGREASRITVLEQDGTPAADTWIRQARRPDGKQCLAVANLAGRSRMLIPQGTVKLGPTQDMVSRERIGAGEEAIPFAPWQIRLLWPRP